MKKAGSECFIRGIDSAENYLLLPAEQKSEKKTPFKTKKHLFGKSHTSKYKTYTVKPLFSIKKELKIRRNKTPEKSDGRKDK